MEFWNSKRMENYEFIFYYIFKNVLKKNLISFYLKIDNFQ